MIGFMFSGWCLSIYTEIPEEDIVDTWVSTEDPNAKIEFTEDGLKKTYYENEMTGAYSYVFVEECEGVTSLEKSPLDTVLRVVSDENKYTCYHVMNLTNERFTLSLFGRGGLSSYERVESGQ